MRIGLVTTGSHGDVHPFLAIGQELARRGHEVVVVAGGYFEPEIRAAGLGFRGFGEHIDVPALLRDPRLMHPRRGPQMVFGTLAEMMPLMNDALRRLHEEATLDAALVHHITFGARWTLQSLGVPVAVAVLAPMLWFNPRDPAPALQRWPGAVGRLAGRAQGRLMRAAVPLTFDRWTNARRREAGVAAERGAFMREFWSGEVNLGLWSPALRPRLEGDPARGVVCGFPFHDRAAPGDGLALELERFLADGPAPVVFSLGTAAAHAPGDFYTVAAAACRLAGLRGVLLTARPDTIPPDLPRDVLACGYAPFSLLLPRAAGFVCHGGIGSVAQGLRAGCPTLVAPHAHDQFNNAVRVQMAGAGLMISRRLTAAKLAAALGRLTQDQSLAAGAQRLARAIADEDGAGRAASEIERMAKGRGRAAGADRATAALEAAQAG